MNLHAVRGIRIPLVLLAAAVLGAPPAAAQQVDTSRITTALWVICPGAELRMAVQGEGLVRGECGRVAGGRLLVTTGSGERQVALAAVDSLWVRRSYTSELTLGLAVLSGVAAGLYANNTHVDDCRGVRCEKDHSVAIWRSVGTGLVGGAAVGVAIGPRFWRWVRRYPD